MKKLWVYLRYDWPVHFIRLMTNWLPDNVVFLRLRGVLLKPFFKQCGKDLRIGRNTFFYRPSLISFGDHVYLAYGCSLMADEQINIGNDVMFAPFSVVVTGNHTSKNGSFRYGPAQTAPVEIGRGCWVGVHAVITPGVSIGENTLIAAGAVVTADIPSGVVAGGVPARVIKQVSEVEG